MRLLENYSYRAKKIWRPQPSITHEESLNLFGLSFTWGEIDLSQKVFENIRIFVEASLNQSEVTNPFGFNESLSSLENALYSGCSLANDVIYKLINSSTLSSGIEGVWMVKRSKELSLVQIGQPQVYLLRNNVLLPLFSATDILSKNPSDGNFIPPRLLGLYSQSSCNLKSISVEKNDELLLLAHSLIPASLHESTHDSSSDKARIIFQKIAREYPNCPFSLSRIKLDQ